MTPCPTLWYRWYWETFGSWKRGLCWSVEVDGVRLGRNRLRCKQPSLTELTAKREVSSWTRQLLMSIQRLEAWPTRTDLLPSLPLLLKIGFCYNSETARVTSSSTASTSFWWLAEWNSAQGNSVQWEKKIYIMQHNFTLLPFLILSYWKDSTNSEKVILLFKMAASEERWSSFSSLPW